MIAKNYTQFQQVLKWLDSQDEVAFDTETDGLSPRKNRVIGIALGNQTEGHYIVHTHLENGEYREYINKTTLNLLWKKLKTKKLITFHGSFDARMVEGYFGIDLSLNIFSEAQLARHTSDEGLSPWDGLKAIASGLFGVSETQEQQDLNESIIAKGGKPGHVWLGDLELVGKYAEKDAVLTAKVEAYFRKSVIDQGLWKFYQEDEVMPLYREVTIGMEKTGVKLDIPLMLQTKSGIEADIVMLEAKIREEIAPHLELFDAWYLAKSFTPKASGEFAQMACKFYNVELPLTANGAFSFAAKAIGKLPDGTFKQFITGEARLPDSDVLAIQRLMRGNGDSFNLKSKHHWKKLFFDTLHETPLSYTEETRQPQCDDDFLESIKHKYSFVAILLDYNKLNKILGTYIERFLTAAEDGRFYPRFQQHTTISGRYSGDLQQLNRPIPKEDLDAGKVSLLVYKYNNIIRSFFIADNSNIFVDCDYNSLEPHVFAHVSGDDNLKCIFTTGLDFYSEIAIRTEKIQHVSSRKSDSNYLGKADPSRRQKAKAYSLGIPYGLGPYALSKHLACPESEAKVLHRGYLEAFPQLAEWMNQCKQDFINHGIAKVESGRIRRFPKAHQYYKSFGPVLLDPLKVYDKWKDNPSKYKEMKYLSSQVRNAVNNSRNVRIQGLAASITNRASVAINRRLRELGWGIVVAQIHDQLLVSVKEEHAEEAAKIVQDCMENTYKLSIPLKAPPTLAKNFKEGH